MCVLGVPLGGGCPCLLTYTRCPARTDLLVDEKQKNALSAFAALNELSLVEVSCASHEQLMTLMPGLILYQKLLVKKAHAALQLGLPR